MTDPESSVPATSALLELNGLRTWFHSRRGEIRAVDGVDLSVGRGEVLGLVGESGSGKTVTMLSAMRLVEPPGRVVAGSITYAGRDVLAMSAKELRTIRGKQMSMIFQQPNASLHPCFTAGEQIGEALGQQTRMSSKARRLGAIDLLRQVGIPDPQKKVDAFPHQMSGGQAQRVMIAMALASEPALLIADEPTTALDVTIQAQILDLMRQLQADTGTAVVLITHDLGVVAEMADRVAVMYGGQIVEQAPVNELFADPKHPYTQGLLGSVPVLGARQEELTVIRGRVPVLIDPPPGCRFAPRCPQRMEICTQATPALVDLAGRQVRCFLHSDAVAEEVPVSLGRTKR